MTKFCKDCKWSRPDTNYHPQNEGYARFATCTNPKTMMAPKIDLVTGKPKREPPNYCSSNRLFNDHNCGIEGRYFEDAFAVPEFEGTTIDHDPNEFKKPEGKVLNFIRRLGAK